MTASGYAYDVPSVGEGFASADLATGELRLSSLASGVGSEQTYGHAQASIVDTLHFTVTTPTPIVVKLHVDGNYFGYVQPSFGFDFADGASTLDTYGRWADGSNPYIDLSSPTTVYSPFDTDGTWTGYGPRDFVGEFTIDPLRPDVHLEMTLEAGGSTGPTFANFDTAAVSFDLPAGVTFTSDSGVFLTASPTAVPEPRTWAMLIAGLAFVGAASRRIRTHSSRANPFHAAIESAA